MDPLDEDTHTLALGASPAPRPRGLAGPPLELPRGTTVGRYTVLELVGRGGMGEVYAAYDPKLDRKIALKLLQTDESRPEARAEARLLREAKAIARVSHPNVVTVHDAGTFGDRVFVAMEFVEGGTLKDWLAAAPRGRREILAVFVGAARGLAAAHAAGLVHRDFKPPNVMVGKDDSARVMDFGLVRQLDAGASDGDDDELEAPARPPADAVGDALPTNLTLTGELLGTPRYMAPEQFKAEHIDARTDQFAFCVALHEALYGQLPFAGDTLPVLMANVLGGHVSPPPPKATVPGWLRRVLLRGLEVDPARRFPSMEALVETLETDPTARRRRLALAVGLVACVALVAVGARRLGGGSATLCRGGAARWATAWSPTDAPGASREAIHRAFSATGKTYAEQAFASVSRLFDDYGRAWTAMYTDACEATQVRGEQSSEVLDLRMSCLQGRLGSARALTDLFARADGPVVENAVAAADALPRVDRCADVGLLKAVVKPPEDEALRSRVEALRGELARVIALRDAGHCQESDRLAENLVPRVRATGYLPLLSDTLLAAGFLSDDCGSIASGEARLEEAFTTALASRNDETAAGAAAVLAPLLADRAGKLVDADRWLTLGRAVLGRFDNHPLLDTWQLVAEGIVALAENRAPEAAELFRRSAVAKEKLLGPDSVDTNMSFNDEANALVAAGRAVEALAIFADVVQRLTRAVGADHPRVGMALGNEGEALNSVKRYEDAARVCRRAAELFRAAGSDPLFSSYGLTCLGVARLGQGRGDEAVTPLEQALRIRTGASPDRVLRGETRFALARALWSRPAEHARALALARDARVDYAAGGARADKIAEIDGWLAALDRRPAHDALSTSPRPL